MGIRFTCPNGHKLNVKEYQAGRKGVCPVCGVKMQIPWQSTRPSSKEAESQVPTGVAAPPNPTPVSAAPIAAVDVLPGGAPPPPPPPPAALPASPADPLVEAGNVVWYVRPPSGGQYGPAAADVMRGWLSEGRITADALVWREGWRDWQQAGDVFPQLPSSATIPGLETLVVEPAAATVPLRPSRGRTQERTVQLLVVAGLAAAAILLLIIFLFVMMNQ